MHAASTMKVPVMLELFRRAQAGELSLDDSLPVRNRFRSIADGSAYCLSAADDSDPELYRHLGERLPLRELVRAHDHPLQQPGDQPPHRAGGARAHRRAPSAPLGASEIRVLRGVEDGPAFERGMNNTTTAYGMMKVMEAVARGDGLTPASREEMLSILEAQEFREMIPAGLPPGVRVGNKTGWITGINHDAAIVLPRDRAPYVLVVLTRGYQDPEAAHALVRELSHEVYAALVP